MRLRNLLQWTAVAFAISAAAACAIDDEPAWLTELRQAHNAILNSNYELADKSIATASAEVAKQGGRPSDSLSYPEALEKIGFAYETQGKFENAERFYKMSYELAQKNKSPQDDPDSAMDRLGRLYIKMGRAADAKTCFDQVLKNASPALISTILDIQGDYCAEHKDFKGAEIYYLEAVHREGEAVFGRLHFAEFLTDRGRFNEAENLYKTMLATDDTWTKTWVDYGLGEVYRKQDRYEEAKKEYEQVIKEAMDETDICVQLSYAGLAELEDKKGNYTGADGYYKKADPTLPATDYLESYAAFLKRHNRVEEASKVESDLKKTLETESRSLAEFD
jgi:tetratricopeptide (TPR) repeat protein